MNYIGAKNTQNQLKISLTKSFLAQSETISILKYPKFYAKNILFYSKLWFEKGFALQIEKYQFNAISFNADS